LHINESDLPAWALNYLSLSLISLEVYKGEPIAWLSLMKPLTYGEISIDDPVIAAQFKRAWEKSNPAAQLTMETVLATDEVYLGLGMSRTDVRTVYEFSRPKAGTEWFPSGCVFHLQKDGVWISAFNQKTGQTGVSRVL
jgi:hypothetical protein